MMNWIRKYWLIPLGIILAGMCYIVICALGNQYKVNASVGDAKDIKVSCEADSDGEVTISDIKRDGDKVTFTVTGKKSGRVFIKVTDDLDEEQYLFFGIYYVHKNGVVTSSDYLGACRGMFFVNVVFLLYLILMIMHFVSVYKKSVGENLYRYKNILYLGLNVFICTYAFIFLIWFLGIISQKSGNYNNGIVDMLMCFISSNSSFAMSSLPVVVILGILVTISNIKLMKNEGFTWRNLLGTFLGILVMIFTIAPEVVYGIILRKQVIDIFNWTGVGRFVFTFFDNLCGCVAVYIQCLLYGTIIIAVKAAKRVPHPDKDYILILGCMINKDGSLTKLLKGRADRAIEFAAFQKEKTNKDIIFVPSGGQGSDEVISEAKAIGNYLLEKGIDKDRILLEDKSLNTEQNIKNSYELIKRHSGSDQAKIAFSTTNYHVFRAGLLATDMSIEAEGIGSKTKRYFWINAFVREFIATIVKEKKAHAILAGVMLIVNVAAILLLYWSNVIQA